jgi:hypothetical protein
MFIHIAFKSIMTTYNLVTLKGQECIFHSGKYNMNPFQHQTLAHKVIKKFLKSENKN